MYGNNCGIHDGIYGIHVECMECMESMCNPFHSTGFQWNISHGMMEYANSIWNQCGKILQNEWALSQNNSIWNGWNPHGMVWIPHGFHLECGGTVKTSNMFISSLQLSTVSEVFVYESRWSGKHPQGRPPVRVCTFPISCIFHPVQQLIQGSKFVLRPRVASP